MSENIPWAETLRQMRKIENDHPIPFDVEFVKADRKRKTAGDIVQLRGVIVSGLMRGKGSAAKHKEKLQKTIARDHRMPHHYEHQTMNLYNRDNQETTKVHPRLITKFNGMNVIY